MTDLNSAVDKDLATNASTRLNGEPAQLPSTILETDVPAVVPETADAVPNPATNGHGDEIRISAEESGPQPAKTLRLDGPDGSARPANIIAAQQTDAPIRVTDIRKNAHDDRGEKIDFVFFRRRNFAIYRSGGKIMVQYADDEAVAKDQIAGIADLMPLRDRLHYLVKDMATPQSYHWQIAEALRLGLNGQKDAAISTMQAAINDITTTRQRKGRITYLICAWALVLGAVALLSGGAAAIWLFCDSKGGIASGLDRLLMATGSGAVGALLSTAIALRSRTVAVDGDLKSNAMDSVTRIMIGVISAAALYLILDSKLLEGVKIGAMNLKLEVTWQVALLAGFAAGFLERLVPDLLEKKLAVVTK
jgi:hypothetical protein